MPADRLDDAFRALRAEAGGSSANANRTLDRVLATTRAKAKRRRRAWRLFVPLAAVLVASSAWAGATGRLTSIWDGGAAQNRSAPTQRVHVGETGGVRAGELAPPVSPPAVDPTSDEASAVDPAPSGDRGASASAMPDPAAATPSPSAVPRDLPPTTHEHAAPRVAAATPTPSATTPGEPSPETAKRNLLAADKAAFEAAYRVYASGSPAAAVGAWDGYLKDHPSGRFVPEARYARAVALVRSGQAAAAREALRPFADGAPGSYRRDDAIQLLETLGH